MKKILSNIYTLAALLMAGAAFTACSSSEDSINEQPADPTMPKTCTLTVNATKGDASRGQNGTRSSSAEAQLALGGAKDSDATTRALALDESGIKNVLNATWTVGDKVIVYLNRETRFGYPELGTLTAQSSGESTTLTGTIQTTGITVGGGFGDPVETYDLTTDDKLYLSYSGTLGEGLQSFSQQQDGTLQKLADYFDYAGADVTVSSVSGSTVTISEASAQFENLSFIIRFTLQDMATGSAISPSNLAIKCETTGAYPVESRNNIEIPATTYQTNGEGVVFVQLPRTNQTTGFTGDITLTATVGDDTYTYTKSGVNFTNGKYYEITVKMSKVVVDLSKNETANCYIVPAKGSYKFKATVKGNGSADLAGVSKTTDAATISSASLVWASFGTSTAPAADEIIKDISYSDGYVYFSTADTYREGNAVVAIKDADGNILWSWHLWICNYDESYLTGANSVKMMNRNLGALSTDGSYLGYGMYYQWGRKDPFLGTTTPGSDVTAKVHGTAKSIVTGAVPLATAIQNPANYYIQYNTADRWENGDHWCSDNTKMTLWAENSKTIFDPCPPGWRVPTHSEITGMGTNYYTSTNGFYASGYYNTNGVFTQNTSNDAGTLWKSTVSGSCGGIEVIYNLFNSNLSRSPDMGFNIRPVK